jgi:hypothetical protein
MSFVLKILDILDAEVNRQLERSRRELKEDISSLGALDLSRLIRGVDQRLRTKILKSIDPPLVSEAMKSMDVHMEAACWNDMGQKRRLRVLDFYPAEEINEALMRLHHWQTLEQSNWPGKILPLLVRTTEIPAHYGPHMGNCVVCKGWYSRWESVIVADCRAHTFHEGCETEEGVCPSLGCSGPP